MIQLQAVSIAFESRPLLKNLNLAIAPKESFVLVGPSGHGKSVLLKLMAGILRPTQGQVIIAGNDIKTCAPSVRRKLQQQMGMLFQKNALFDSLTVEENVEFPLRETTQLSREEIKNRASQYLKAVGLSHAQSLYPDEISGGMQKRLGIARALALRPQIVLYDDPTAGLDPITSRMIIELINELKVKNQSTVVAVTNDMNRAYQLADRIGMVVHGEMIVTGSCDETKVHSDIRVRQFISGELLGPLTEKPSSGDAA